MFATQVKPIYWYWLFFRDIDIFKNKQQREEEHDIIDS